MASNVVKDQAEAFVASDYQGETIQVFVFLRGKFLGYQCFGQDRLTIGGAPGMDLPLPDCPEAEGCWDVYVSRGALYAWFRSPAGGNGKEGREDPRKVQPLDSFSLGEYRLQARLLVGQGLELPAIETEEDLTEEEAAPTREEESPEEDPSSLEKEQSEEEREADSSVEMDEKEQPVLESAPEPSDEVEGISLDYARSIWREEIGDERAEATEVESGEVEAESPQAEPDKEPEAVEEKDTLVGQEEAMPSLALDAEESLDGEQRGVDLPDEPGRFAEAEALPADEEAQSLAEEDQEEESEEEPSFEASEDVEAESPSEVDLDYAKFWGLSEESDAVEEGAAVSDPEADEPDPLNAEARAMEEIEEWIGFGLEEERPAEDGSHAEEAEEEEPREEALEAIPPDATGEEETQVEEEPQVSDAEEAPEQHEAEEEEGDDGLITLAEEQEPAEEEAVLPEQEVSLSEPTGQPEGLQDTGRLETNREQQKSVQSTPAAGSGGLVEGMSQEERTRFWDEMAREAFANQEEKQREPDELPAAELPVEAIGHEPSGEEEAEYEEEYEEEAEQDITYFSLLKEVFPSRTNPPKATRGDHRALEVIRFRGSDVQDIGYLEREDDYTIRKGWSRRLWKRKGGVPPNFKLVRLKNGGLAELHIRDSVKGRLYSEDGSQDIWDLRGGKRGRFGRKGKASWLPLPADTWAVLRVNSGRYLVRYVPPRPKPMVQPLRPKVSMGQFKLISLSMLSHLLLILAIGLVVPDTTLEGYNRTDQFARIDPHALKALKPPPPPKKLEKPKPVAKKKAPKPKPKPPVASKHRVPKSAKESPVPTQGKVGSGGKKQVDVAQTGLLAALGSQDAGVLDAKGNSEILLAAVTNLDAVAVPSDTTTFNLAGVAGKLATSEIQVPTSDVIETVGAAQLIKNGDGTLGAMASRGSGEVRAVVHEPPKAKISIRGGMSREAVLKVVNAHLDEIRDCYERELLHNPGISGKILMEWLIQLDGTVRYAKVKFTNIGHSSDLHSCLQAQVVTWNFPRPKGGEEVLVTFPFLFESMGF